MLPIKYIQKTCLIDFPGKVSCVVFLGGCNFRCGFCHNPDLVENKIPDISEQEVFDFLEKRKKWIDGVVISGGEPLLYDEISSFVEKIKKMGYLIKIDTNGTNPRLLKRLIDKNLVDYIAMDIKNSLDKYKETVEAEVNLDDIKKSVELIKNSSLDYEFRTTIVPSLHTKEDIERIGTWLKGAKKFVIQNFRPKNCLDKEFEKKKSFSKEILEEFKAIVSKFIDNVEIRD